ncbi:T9SS C-terminal target domain-containing protein [Lutibacter sp. HS1-25]|uniref:LamG-like jellyroll fold domain-containing protein n=1 Tax=Lutibacter sp. HS1-25 TaxID=2485000 RepID=UPI00101261CA|nr:LamG-like jellyroll fold domain-containing protein [Lutibacter sp. HS1-25]RXP46588.1 T9SS C-terminal target domain-containing protein [Lutibacter sp. HS1-25]
MKTKLLFLISSFLCLNLFSQTYLVNDNFEDDALGVLPAGWVIRYNGTGNANQKIVESPVKNGIHSFQVSGSSWAANISKSISGIPNEVTLEGWIRAENVATGGRCGLALGNPSFGTWGTFIARIEFYNGNLITYYHTGNSGGYGTQYVLQAATSQTWYHVKIEANRVTSTYKVYINGELASSNTTGTTITQFPLLTTVPPTSAELYGNSMVYFDDIKLYKTTNLAAYYPFNGNANDESGNANHGTVNGATLTTDRFGNENSAYGFDGASNYISIVNNPQINISNGQSYTVSFWCKHNAQNNGEYLISKYKGTYGEPSYAFGTGTYGDSYSWFEFTPSNGIENRGAVDLNDNNWHNITTVFKSGESVSIYVDGVLDISNPTTYTGSIINTRNLTIGCGSNLRQFYNGSIDDIKIYNIALSANDIIAEYNNTTAGINDFKQLETNFYVFENVLYFKNNQNLSEIKTIEIFNLMGQQIYNTSTIKKEIPIQHLQKGIYILKVENIEGYYSTLKFIIN